MGDHITTRKISGKKQHKNKMCYKKVHAKKKKNIKKLTTSSTKKDQKNMTIFVPHKINNCSTNKKRATKTVMIKKLEYK